MATTTDLRVGRSWHNETDRYGWVSQGFHWLTALLFVTTVVLGLILDNWARGHPTREAIILVHKSIGLTILALAVARLSWLLRSPPPAPDRGLAVWERRLSWAVHKLLYVLLFALPISGILLSQAAGKEVSLFGVLTLPQMVPVDPAVPPGQRPLVMLGSQFHTVVLKYALFAVVGLHILGAVKHAWIDRDPAMMRRIWGR